MRHPSLCGKSPPLHLISSADEVAGSDNHLPFQPQSSLFTDRNNIFWTAHYVSRGGQERYLLSASTKEYAVNRRLLMFADGQPLLTAALSLIERISRVNSPNENPGSLVGKSDL
ncbi:hypothetical protein HNY73_014966 [Argiope bruennichi]|uniref:Uncharacterized protein n=1 Tax=Argiope bruennichi TaxID=94029 RepID=A0A8T0ESJ5_ARGBR|nr:hypothetical protein HNY73_014966 [Argiope bruennichi]